MSENSDSRIRYAYFKKEELDLLCSIVDNLMKDKNKTDTEKLFLEKEDWIKITEIFNSKTKYDARETDDLVRYFGNMGRRGIAQPCPTKFMLIDDMSNAIERAKVELIKLQTVSVEREIEYNQTIQQLGLEDFRKSIKFNEAKREKMLMLLDLEIKKNS